MDISRWRLACPCRIGPGVRHAGNQDSELLPAGRYAGARFGNLEKPEAEQGDMDGHGPSALLGQTHIDRIGQHRVHESSIVSELA